jgi:hypothetical protein
LTFSLSRLGNATIGATQQFLTFSLSRLGKVNMGQIVIDAFSGPSVEWLTRGGHSDRSSETGSLLASARPTSCAEDVSQLAPVSMIEQEVTEETESACSVASHLERSLGQADEIDKSSGLGKKNPSLAEGRTRIGREP